ncbi:Rad17-domain-containing protein [Pholiota conissans]|uniref:Rad17-domain-containing protein n=1 Tax=Pholiota conissans TaxID=109636 RepID=A0A9P5Z5E7_9AGAR|nr:Rad17-domain-containing protein [Pholiota conissans]
MLSATQKKAASSKSTRPRTVRLGSDGPSTSATQSSKRFDPMTAFAKSQTPTPPPLASKPMARKGKGRETSKTPVNTDDSLWVDLYEPSSEAELAVHVKKVEDVRRWLSEAFDGGPSGKLTKYRRILAMTGSAGTGKTSTLRILAREMGFEILEWRNSIAEPISVDGDRLDDYEGLFTKFEAFLTRASTCNNVFSGSSNNSQASTKRVILLEDLPNIFHTDTQTRFHEALTSLVTSSLSSPPTPLVVIISDAGMRGEASDERRAEGGGWGKDKAQVLDVRTVLSKDLLGGPYVTEIGFNPIAPTLMRKALQAIVNRHFTSKSTSSMAGLAPSKEVLDLIVESSNGDIRSAIMALQFACIVEIPGQKRKNAKKGTSFVMEAITRREQSLALFHLIGKVLYNKRKNDPPNASASAKDLRKEQAIDELLKDPEHLPAHLKHHERRTSRVDVDLLYADSPIETSLFSLYIHQNYTQYCTELEHCEGVADWLSWIDSSGGDAWYLANPHQFHLLTLGTLHSLPSPVPRRSQKSYKPEFFSFLQKEKDAWDGVRNVRDWIAEKEIVDDECGWRAGGWTKNDVILELGGVLKAREANPNKSLSPIPPVHRLFSRMEFTRTGNTGRLQQFNEGDLLADEMPEHDPYYDAISPTSRHGEKEQGGWLESDDIDDFD